MSQDRGLSDFNTQYFISELDRTLKQTGKFFPLLPEENPWKPPPPAQKPQEEEIEIDTAYLETFQLRVIGQYFDNKHTFDEDEDARTFKYRFDMNKQQALLTPGGNPTYKKYYELTSLETLRDLTAKKYNESCQLYTSTLIQDREQARLHKANADRWQTIHGIIIHATMLKD